MSSQDIEQRLRVLFSKRVSESKADVAIETLRLTIAGGEHKELNYLIQEMIDT